MLTDLLERLLRTAADATASTSSSDRGSSDTPAATSSKRWSGGHAAVCCSAPPPMPALPRKVRLDAAEHVLTLNDIGAWDNLIFQCHLCAPERESWPTVASWQSSSHCRMVLAHTSALECGTGWCRSCLATRQCSRKARRSQRCTRVQSWPGTCPVRRSSTPPVGCVNCRLFPAFCFLLTIFVCLCNCWAVRKLAFPGFVELTY